MHSNLLARAIGQIKSNPSSSAAAPPKSDHSPSSEQKAAPATDILSRIKKPAAASSSLVIKDPVGGKEARQEARVPYSRSVEAAKKVLGGRFIPKGELINQPWKHDLCPVQDKPKHRVFLRGVPAGTTADTLRQIFAKYGEITGLQVEKETADVYFATKYSAQKAASESNGVIVGGKKIKVSLCEEEKKRVDEKTEETKAPEKVLEADRSHRDPQSILARIKKPTKP